MKTLSDYMKMNYRMEIVEDAEEGGFVVSFPELSGCLTCGDTKEKAIKIKRESILLGTPVIQAYRQESIAPPFGIALHNSCKLDLDRNKHFNNEWLLWAGASRELIDELKKCVNEYFEYYKWQTSYSGYSEDKIKEHMIDFAQYVHLFEFLAKET